MPHIDHTAAYEEFRDRVLNGIKSHFPLNGKLQTIHLEGLDVKEGDLHSDDIVSQKEARLRGDTWAAPVTATLALKDNQTGKLVDRKTMRIADIPLMTRRHSFIIDGNEYQVGHQWQLKPGAYGRRRQTGELEVQFNIANKQPFDVTFNPRTKQFRVERGTTKAIGLYPLLKGMGVDDDSLRKLWGSEIFEANREARLSSSSFERFYKADKKVAPPSPDEARRYTVDTLMQSQMRPDATQLTLGKPLSNVTGEALTLASKKLLHIHGGGLEDDRDSLLFKDLRSVGDFAHDRLTNWKVSSGLRAKVSRKINFAKGVRDVVKFDMFNEPLRRTFTEDNGASRVASQVNPVEMLSGAQQTTLMGPGGIKSAFKIETEAKFINPSHMGYLDPLHTPEGDKTGVTLRLPMGLKRDGATPVLPLYNLRTNKTEYVEPATFYRSKVVMPDQVEWKGGRPVPRANRVQMSVEGNKLGEGRFSDAHYVMRHPSQLFNITSNLIPFLGNNSGNRATYATHHIEQAISLRDRESPLVQVATGSDKEGLRTFEELLGRQSGHPAPVSGTVEKVTARAVSIKSKDGKSRTVQLYDNFPLNDPKAVLHSTPIVKVGDKVQIGQSVADTNFTKNGVLALGTNLRVGYLPFKGYNFEDGVVISDSAARKLSSVHLHKPSIKLEESHVTDPRKFSIQHPGAFSRDQYAKVGTDGIVRVGQRVEPGDPLVMAMRPFQLKDRMGVGAVYRSLSGQHTDTSLRWDSDYPGEVVGTSRNKKGEVTVHVRTTEPMQVGDKISGRHGNKGIVSVVLPDREMPHTKDGKALDVVLNPSGVPGRMNLGQMLETAASKIARKTGKPYVVSNFDPHDAVETVKSELKKHGLHDTEELHDPLTGMSLGHAMVGDQYMLKLMYTIDKKIAARAGMGLPGIEPERYDFNLIPSSGGKSGGQSIGSLGLNALLAHGAKANIREMQTWKSEGPDPQPSEAKRWPSQHIEVWQKIQTGQPLPAPAPTFAFKKFTDMLKAAGINIEKRGHTFQLQPMTDAQVLAMSRGELTKPTGLTYTKLNDSGEPVPKPGGLFDVKVTGGHGGKSWSHIKLAEPIPNPVYESAIQKLLGMRGKDYSSVVNGERAVSSAGEVVPLGTSNSLTGGPAIKSMLDKIDVKKELESSKRELANMRLPKNFAVGSSTAKLDKLVKKVKYLQVLDDMKVKPSEAYILHNLPVIPPVMRPVSILPDGSMNWADLNGLYQKFAQVNEGLGNPKLRASVTDENLKKLRTDAYDGVKAIMGLGGESDGPRGILEQIHGSQPKTGYFQKTLLSRRQDMTMRSVIVPEPSLGLDEVGVPEKKAMTMFRPFVVRQLVQMGAASNPLEAQNLIKSESPYARRALDLVAEDRPVLLKRDPALHKHSVQAFKAKIVPGRAIQIHPLTVSGYNADFDGDTMSMYVPISRDAVDEARKMFPSNNLFNEATGAVVYQPTLESALGLYKLSRITRKAPKEFGSGVDALKAVQAGKLAVTDPVVVGGARTTAGRMLLADALPEPMRDSVLKGKEPIDKKGLNSLFTRLAKDHPSEFSAAADRLKDLGNGMAFGAIELKHPDMQGPTAIIAKERPSKFVQYLPSATHSLSLEDVGTDRASRDRVLAATQREVDRVHASTSFTNADKERRSVDLWMRAGQQIDAAHKKKIQHEPTNLSMMQEAGVKPSWDQYKQMVIAPLLVKDASGRIIPTPIKRSYSEGLDLGGYWTQMSGARRGSVMKVQETQDPGALSKYLVNSTMNLVVADHDCGTTRGVPLHAGSKEVYDRVLARPFSSKGMHVPAGTILSTDVVGKILSTDKNAQLIVRSPLKCEHPKGLCQLDAGVAPNGKLHPIGTNLGVIAAQSLGERSMQVTLKAFHSGGVVSSGGKQVVDDFERIEQLTHLPKKIPDAASLAMVSGKVDKVEHDATGTRVTINGHVHHVGKDRSGRSLAQVLPNAAQIPGYQPWQPPKIGSHVEAGQPLSDPNRTNINPHDLYRATRDMERVQNFLTDELHKIYQKEGVRRSHVETVVKAMSNLTKVRDPGDAENVLRGDFQPYSKIRALNGELVRAGKHPIEHTPVLQGIKVLPLNLQEDWMAKLRHNNLRATLQEAAATGAISNIHGLHPIPGVAYGAEFGLTSKEHLRPGFEKLRDVPIYAY